MSAVSGQGKGPCLGSMRACRSSMRDAETRSRRSQPSGMHFTPGW